MSKRIVFFIISFMISISCHSGGEIYMSNINSNWDKNDIKKIEFDIKNALEDKGLIFVLRNNEDYPYSNIFLISTIKDEKNNILNVDTLQYILAKPNGEWYGKGMGSVKEIWLQYKNKYKFPNDGKYKLELKHGMRVDKLIGIEDIGLSIENANK